MLPLQDCLIMVPRVGDADPIISGPPLQLGADPLCKIIRRAFYVHTTIGSLAYHKAFDKKKPVSTTGICIAF